MTAITQSPDLALTQAPLSKLYIATHAHLSAGYQTAQVSHAVTEFIFSFPQAAREWYEQSNTIVAVEARSTEELHGLVSSADKLGLGIAPFFEPDLGGELTAVAFCPAPQVSELLASFPLAGRILGDQRTKLAREREYRYGPSQDALF